MEAGRGDDAGQSDETRQNSETGRDDEQDVTHELKPAIRRVSEEEHQRTDEQGNVAGSLDADQPLEPQQIHPENALFVLLGIALVVGFLVLAIQGL